MLRFHRLRAAASALAFSLLTTAAPAQIAIDVPTGPLTPGATIKVGLSDPSKAGSSVQVDISDGGGSSSSVTITLDGSGYGSANWVVPAWGSATFTYASAQEFRYVL